METKFQSELSNFNKRMEKTYRIVLEELSMLRIIVHDMVSKLHVMIKKKSGLELVEVYEKYVYHTITKVFHFQSISFKIYI